MRGKSHCRLGSYLTVNYMRGISSHKRRAFLIGCIQPDRNPMTYLKGSLRHQWLRGHNYPNTQRYMTRISHRLEKKQRLRLLDYYTLGKLIHYTADAFTYAHNDRFPDDLNAHMKYEAGLQRHFLAYLDAVSIPTPSATLSIMDSIRDFHREYCTLPGNIHTDSQFAFLACCTVASRYSHKVTGQP